jgi:hypothetical protein
MLSVMGQRGQPFIGSEALASGRLNRHGLRTRYRSELPNVYVSRQSPLSLSQRITAAWLWSGQQAVIAGAAAAALHGAKWVDDDVPVELVYAKSRSPNGVVVRRETLLDDEVQTLTTPGGDLRVTVPERTAFDIGRHTPGRLAVARLDALARAAKFRVDDVTMLARRHPRTHGLCQLAHALDLVDAGAQSPKETYLRLLLTDAGLPPEQTQIPVAADETTYYLDMGWPDRMVAVEYDGDQHQLDRWQYRKDIHRLETLDRLGWIIIRVIAEDRPPGIVGRVRQALQLRG